MSSLCRSVSGTNISIPTHYFVLVTSCRDSALSVDGCHGELQTVSFLLPHRPDNSESCKVKTPTTPAITEKTPPTPLMSDIFD